MKSPTLFQPKLFVKAKYDFGMIRITPGNVTDYDVSDGVIDYVDINLVNVFL